MTKKILVLSAALILSANLRAQVTIGGLNEPKAGAILDLNSDTKGGLVLSNVEIDDWETIPANTFVNISGEQDVNLDLAGMMVYNTGTTNLPTGIYIWNGDLWTKAGYLPPIIAQLDPRAGPLTGATPITITGMNLETAYELFIDFNGNGKQDAGEACPVNTKNDTQITCQNPVSAAEGTYNVIIKTWGGATIYGDNAGETGFKYTTPTSIIHEITASGNWTVPAGYTSIDIFAVGGGGGGAGTNSTNTGNSRDGGTSGGGGGYTTTALSIAVTPGEQLDITVGGGGLGQTGANGLSGSASSVKRAATVLVQANGGNGGGLRAAGGNGGSGGGGGTGRGGNANDGTGQWGIGSDGGSDGGNGLSNGGGDGGAIRYPGGVGQGTSTRCPFNNVLYAGGGGGLGSGNWNGGIGGAGGGGAANGPNPGVYDENRDIIGGHGSANTGGGGGGGNVTGGNGGSGIIIIRYLKYD